MKHFDVLILLYFSVDSILFFFVFKYFVYFSISLSCNISAVATHKFPSLRDIKGILKYFFWQIQKQEKVFFSHRFYFIHLQISEKKNSKQILMENKYFYRLCTWKQKLLQSYFNIIYIFEKETKKTKAGAWHLIYIKL